MPYVSADLLLDYLGINFDGEKGIAVNTRFVLAIEPQKEGAEIAYQRVGVYKGTVLHTEIGKDHITPEDLVIRIRHEDLYRLASGQYQNIKQEKIDEKAQQILQQLAEYIVDTGKYQNFNLIEPLEEE